MPWFNVIFYLPHLTAASGIAIGFMVFNDLVKYQSLVSQYIHFVTYLGLIFASIYLTGKPWLRFWLKFWSGNLFLQNKYWTDSSSVETTDQSATLGGWLLRSFSGFENNLTTITRPQLTPQKRRSLKRQIVAMRSISMWSKSRSVTSDLGRMHCLQLSRPRQTPTSRRRTKWWPPSSWRSSRSWRCLQTG